MMQREIALERLALAELRRATPYFRAALCFFQRSRCALAIRSWAPGERNRFVLDRVLAVSSNPLRAVIARSSLSRSGLRISEALALRWSDVDWLGSGLTIRRGIVAQVVDGRLCQDVWFR